MQDPIFKEVHRRIKIRGMTIVEAATEIGIGSTSLQRHMAGDYVRSDSLAKYRRWLDGLSQPSLVQQVVASVGVALPEIGWADPLGKVGLAGELAKMGRLNVVDLFCGCGGMSLGFERYEDSKVFRTALALDIEAPMVRVFNDNHPSASREIGIGRQVDITEFTCEAEVRAFYLDHLSRTSGNSALQSVLSSIRPFSLDDFQTTLRLIDGAFLLALANARGEPEYLRELRHLAPGSLGQTSVIGFHNALKLPATGTAAPRLGPLLWYAEGFAGGLETSKGARIPVDRSMVERFLKRYRTKWDAEKAKLSERAGGSGRGQLASAADRIDRFRTFLETKAMAHVKSLWASWRAERDAARATFFENAEVIKTLDTAYETGNRVSVLLGGPPCQGFSRIGRGKIRSLREQSVHVHEDVDSVDSRNQLMHQYVLFVAALAPDVFLFENVRHFQAVVRSEGVEFDAADVLAEAISNVSSQGLGYEVARSIVVASQHAVPQARERFVMAGVRQDTADRAGLSNAPALCLRLQKHVPLPLQIALQGLAAPAYANDAVVNGNRPVSTIESPGQPGSAEHLYNLWTRTARIVDAHIARPPRKDDAALFSLMGPGTRWMDYRCEKAPTLDRLRSLIAAVSGAISNDPRLEKKLGILSTELSAIQQVIDGSLSLRLLLENIPAHPGEVSHHLLTDTYLAKREGAHGDWLSRMDSSVPSKTVVSHMSKDTYAFVHPHEARTISVREAARIQAFPDDYKFGSVGLVDGFKVVGNAVPPLLSLQFADRVARILSLAVGSTRDERVRVAI